MVHGQEEDASLKKCRITLLQLIDRAGRGQSPWLWDSTIPAAGEHPALFIRLKEDGWGGGGEGSVGRSETQKGKQNTTFLQVKVLMPIILLLTSIFELLEMEVF